MVWRKGLKIYLKMKKIDLGIIGHGFVGRATANGFKIVADLKIYDIKDSPHKLEEVVSDCDLIFLCLPTPMAYRTGKIDLSIIKKVISDMAKLNPGHKVLIIRSTVVPGTTRELQEKYPQFSFVFNPEFLTEKNFLKDFLNPNRIIIGGNTKDDPSLTQVKALYKLILPKTPIFLTNFETAEFSKYLANNFLATKVAFFNEQYQNAQNNKQIDWSGAVEMTAIDPRIGPSHTKVPGGDGEFGFGGKCLPKDLASYISWAKKTDQG